MNKKHGAPGNRRLAVKRKLPLLATAGPSALWLLIFVVLPMLYVVAISFMTRNNYGGIVPIFTLNNYRELFDPLYVKVIWESLKLAFYTTVLCLLVGYPFAYYIASLPSKRAAKLVMLIMIPFWTNTMVRLYSWQLLAQPKSILNDLLMGLGILSEPLDLLYTNGLVVLGLFSSMLPFAVLPLYSAIEKLDRSLLEASNDLGGKPYVTFLRVTLPLTMPGVFSAVIMVFIPALGMYTVPEVLGGGKVMLIGNLIRNQFLVTRNWPFGAAIAIILILLTLLMIFLYSRIANLDEMEVF